MTRQVPPHGITGDGATDDSEAINAALSSRSLHLASGTYFVGSDLIVPAGRGISGDGHSTILRFGPRARRGLALGDAAWASLLQIEGANSSAVGIAASPGSRVSGVRVERCGVGVDFSSCLNAVFEQIYCYRCGISLKSEAPAATSMPTTTTFRDCYSQEAQTVGLLMHSGLGVCFDRCVFESSKQHGALLRNAPGCAVDASFRGCWFEDNWLGEAARISRFSLEAEWTGPYGMVAVASDGCRFQVEPKTAKAMRLTGVTYSIRDTTLTWDTIPGAIVIEGGRGMLSPDWTGG